MNLIKIVSLLLLVVLILNVIYFSLGRMPVLWFWVILIVVAILAWGVIPKIKNAREN